MSEQHIENLEIRNFKCFKQLDIANIGQVNLIGGKNNTGKTAFLEAVELFFSSDKSYDLVSIIYKVLKRRQNENESREIEIDVFHENESGITISSLPKICSFSQSFDVINDSSNNDLFDGDELPTDILTFSVNNDIRKVSKDTFIKLGMRLRIHREDEIRYIPSSKVNEKDISIVYGILSELKKEAFLTESINRFDNKILALKVIPKKRGVVLKLELSNKESYVLLSSLGEGINRYIAILCAIWSNKNGVLLIDEIENGIHYTNYKKLWEIVFKTSIEANCQIFITTHSKECITAFNDVQFENDAQFEDKKCNAQYFEFYKNLKTDLITASARDKEQLRYALTHEGRIRGE